MLDEVEEIIFGDLLFQTSLSSVFHGQWRASKAEPWVNIILKCFSDKEPTSDHERKVRDCCENEKLFLRKLHEIEPTGYFYMKLLSVLNINGKLLFVLQKGNEDVFEHFSQLSNNNKLRAKKVIKCVRSMIHCLIELHKHNLAHNDIKPENFVFRIAPSPNEVALIDFGFSSDDKKPYEGDSCEGTEMFIHPHATRVQKSPSRMRNDLFAIGISLFNLYAGTYPYKEEDTSKFDRRCCLESFVDGTWQKNKNITCTTMQLPEFDQWCDLVSKLCGGFWKHACKEILTHAFFETGTKRRKISKS